VNVDAHIYTTRDGKLGARFDWTGPDGRPRRFTITPASSMLDFAARMRAALSQLLPPKLRSGHLERPVGSWE
jgi:hypothetical protein